DHYWIVFDKDDAADEDFIQAIELAEKNNIRAAWSNQAFELWIILHYREFRHDCHRSKYDAHIREFIKWYDKNKKSESQGKQLYYHTYPLITSAIANARKIFETHSYAVLISINQYQGVRAC
ncbi:MAG TPA: RloB family protein, partial [Chitinophagaceae bacterium]|nr:RloB family protein [Chitinophagaceae bacterium]